jgi:hypothetical protein
VVAAGRKTGGRIAGTPNRRTAETKEAIRSVVAQFEAAVPDAFIGDAVAFMQLLYRDPAQPIELRLDAAKAASRFERPALAAVMTKDVSNISPLGAVLVPYKFLVHSEASPVVIDAAVEEC